MKRLNRNLKPDNRLVGLGLLLGCAVRVGILACMYSVYMVERCCLALCNHRCICCAGCTIASCFELFLGHCRRCLGCKWYNHYWDLLVLVICAQGIMYAMLWFMMLLSPVIPICSARVDSRMESCIGFKTSGRRPPLVSVCMVSCYLV